MPVTPYHFGLGAAVKATLPRHFSFTVFCFAQVVTDLETALYFLRGEYPLHRWLHTYLGATIVAALCVLVGRPVCQAALRFWGRWRDAPFKRYFPMTSRISIASAMLSAFLGTYSHVFLDSIMHADVEPFSSFQCPEPMLSHRQFVCPARALSSSRPLWRLVHGNSFVAARPNDAPALRISQT